MIPKPFENTKRFERYAMPKQLWGIARLFSERVLSKVIYPAHEATKLKQLNDEGVVVYVLRSKNLLYHLALTYSAILYELPRAYFVGGICAKMLHPFFGLFEWASFRHTPKGKSAREEWLIAKCVESDLPAEIFLRKPATLFGKKTNLKADYVRALVNAQRHMQEPIYLVGHVLILRGRPMQLEPTTADVVFGTSKEPGFLRSLVRILLAQSSARWELSEPLNLKTFIAEHAHLDDRVITKKVRFALLNRMAKIEKAFHGPALKSPMRMRADTLRDPQFQGYLNTICTETGVPKARLIKKARHFYDEIASRFDIDVIRLFDVTLNFIWNRIYDGLKWNKSDIDKLREAAKKGPMVIVPSHKSHVDYLVMSQVLYWEGLLPPHIAAGDNMSFFPMGRIFRRGGAYFIRRTFKGDPMYPQVVKSYLRRLFKEGFTQEFFIEGSRSRTGKTLPPKFGLLSMMVDCYLTGASEDILFIPASISYEKLVEAQSYTRELSGNEKVAESAKSLVSSAKVLKKRYGQVYVTFDEPISLKEFLAKIPVSSDNNFAVLPEVTKALAHKIVYGINQCSVVTSTALVATAFLASSRRALAKPTLMLYVKRMIRYIDANEHSKARFSDGLKNNVSLHIDRALHLLVADNLLHHDEAAQIAYFRVNDKSALSLDYYKNNILHHFVSDAIIATAFMALGGKERKPVRISALFDVTEQLSKIFKFEFIYPVGKTLPQIFAERLEFAERAHIIVRRADFVILLSTRAASMQINFATQLIANFIDAYLVCARRLPQAVERANNKKSLILALLAAIQKSYLGGSIDCPETASKATVEHALLYFIDMGILEYQEGKPRLTQDAKTRLNKIEHILQQAHNRRLYI